MADDPFFPQPRAKGSYREPAARELVVNEPRQDTAQEPVAAAQQQPVITRPLAPEEMPPSVKKAPKLGSVAEEEARFWGGQSFLARYPRACAAVVFGLGVLSTYDSLHTLWHGGFYSRRALFGPPILAAGLFPMLFGFPHDPVEGNPRWWKIAYGVTFGVGCILGVVLFHYLTNGASVIIRVP
jgi:hypothetical protein